MWLPVKIKPLTSESKHAALDANEKEKFGDLLDRVSAIKDGDIIEEVKSYVYKLHAEDILLVYKHMRSIFPVMIRKRWAKK